MWFLLVAVVSGCATLDAGEPDNELPYACGDTVVIGRVFTLGGSVIPKSAASLPKWQSEWNLQVKVKRVVRGAERRKEVPAIAISHAHIRDDRDFLIVLRPVDGGAYELMTAALWNVRPRPALGEPCS